MTPSDEWGPLTRDWRAGGADATIPPLEELRRRERGLRSRFAGLVVGGALLTAGTLLAGAQILRWHPTLPGVLLVLPAVLVVIVLWGLLLFSRADAASAGESSTEFIGAAVADIRRRTATLGILAGLIGVQAFTFLVWAVTRFLERAGSVRPGDGPRWAVSGFAAGLVLAWSLLHRRRLRRELQELEGIHRELSSND